MLIDLDRGWWRTPRNYEGTHAPHLHHPEEKPMPAAKDTYTLPVRMEPDLGDLAKQCAATLGISLNAFVVTCIRLVLMERGLLAKPDGGAETAATAREAGEAAPPAAKPRRRLSVVPDPAPAPSEPEGGGGGIVQTAEVVAVNADEGTGIPEIGDYIEMPGAGRLIFTESGWVDGGSGGGIKPFRPAPAASGTVEAPTEPLAVVAAPAPTPAATIPSEEEF